MRKKERQYVTLGLVFLFGIVAYAAWAGYLPSLDGGAALIDLGNNSTTENTTYQLAVADLQAQVLSTGHVQVTFSLTNEDYFNISSVQVLYALNVADPTAANYTAVNATKDANSTTYSAEIPSSFGDTIYYKVQVTYDGQQLVTDVYVYSITVTDTVAPTVQGITIDYNATTGNATITVNASDNDAIGSVILYYAITLDGNTTAATWSNVTLSTAPYTYTVAVPANQYLDVYVIAQDISGNQARYPAEGSIQLFANETKIISG